MDNFLIIRIIISFLIAGCWIAAATLLAERLGSKIGGLITNLPSNILISLIFIAMINGPTYVHHAVPTIPIGMAINTLFLFAFIVTLKFGLAISTIFSLLVWLVLACGATFLDFKNFWMNILFYALITILAYITIDKTLKIPAVGKSARKYTKIQLLIRALFAGSVVSSVILIARFFNPYVVGIFSTFPAVLLSTMLILKINQNKEFAQATAKILILSSSNIVVYGLAVYFTFPAIGIIWGTIASFLFAFLWVWLLHPIVRRLA